MRWLIAQLIILFSLINIKILIFMFVHIIFYICPITLYTINYSRNRPIYRKIYISNGDPFFKFKLSLLFLFLHLPYYANCNAFRINYIFNFVKLLSIVLLIHIEIKLYTYIVCRL